MKNIYVYTSLLLLSLFHITCLGHQEKWHKISLPNSLVIPCPAEPCGNIGTNVYSTQFPTGPKIWELEKDSNTWRSTQVRWRSNSIDNVKGLSFKGLIYKENIRDLSKKPYDKKKKEHPNEFAVFFHEDKHYGGGGEYGWVFLEHRRDALFYLCANCNLHNQIWYQWPGNSELKAIGGDAAAIENALKNPAMYRYWNITVKPNGNYIIQLVDPVTWKEISCELQTPKNFPNLYDIKGYITITAKKEAEETVKPAPYIHIDEVKVAH